MLDNLIKEAVTKTEALKELEKLVPKVDMEVLVAAVYEVKKDVLEKRLLLMNILNQKQKREEENVLKIGKRHLKQKLYTIEELEE